MSTRLKSDLLTVALVVLFVILVWCFAMDNNHAFDRPERESLARETWSPANRLRRESQLRALMPNPFNQSDHEDERRDRITEALIHAEFQLAAQQRSAAGHDLLPSEDTPK